MDGNIYDQLGEAIDRRLGGVRAKAQRKAAAGPPPPAMFRLWQEKEEPPIGIEEVGSDEEVAQALRGGSETEDVIIIESDDEDEEERMESPSVLFEKMEDLLDKMGRYQQKLVGLCEEVKGWRSNIPKVFLYDSGPESALGRPGERALMVELMKRKHRTYAFSDEERGRLDVDKIPMIHIHTVPHEPWNMRGARYPNPDEERKVVDYLDGKIRTHVADYSSGPYASPWFCFIKPNGTLRWVQDLQRLNAVTVRDAGGLPNADALSESCVGRPIISLIDLYSGNDQFPVYQPDRSVTAMHTPRGLVHMNVAPQGWTNAVAMVQRAMIRAMQSISPHITQLYIDDLAVKGPAVKESDEVSPGIRRFVWKHIQDLENVLSLLEEYNLTASGAKSRHCMREATILGFVCSEKGRRSDVKKTDKITEWSVPFHSITDVRSFLGTCGFWRAVVKNFAAKTEHLRKLVHKDQEWVWGEEQEEVVARMKEEFREGGLVLGAPDYDATETRLFIVETDAGPTALGGVLIQADMEGKERPLRFESRTLCTTERNYSQFKRETLVVLHCLRIFRNYIFGRRFILRVDPTALAYFLRNYVPSDPTVARWLTYIWMFNFELERIPGSKNRADGLSRINWDKQEGETVENTPPVDGFLDQEEDVRLHINKWSPRVPSCVGYPIWQTPSGYEWRNELVLKPFEEEDPWGGKDVQWMIELALTSSHSLVEDMRTIEEGPGQVERHEDLVGGMYLLVNTLLQEGLDQSDSLNSTGNVDEVSESQDDEFEEGEIKKVFRAEEYDGIYLELGLLLSCEMRLRDASDRAQWMLQRYLVRDDHLFLRREVGNSRRVVCGRNRHIDVVAALHDGITGGHRGVQAMYAKISELYYLDGMMDMVGKFCRSCVPCQERSRLRQGERLHPRLEREVGAVVHLDLLFMSLGDQGYNYIFDACDNLSGFVDGRAIRTKTGLVLVSCIEEYYLRYPFVREFIMDRGSEFTCQEVQELLSRSDFTKTVMPRGGRGTRPPRRPLGASRGYERHGPRHRESTSVYDDGDIELFLDSFWDHARRMGWTVAQAIERLRGAGRFEEPIARIGREATTRSEVEWRMQELRPSPVGPDGRPIRLEIENASDFIPAFEWFMQGQGIPRHGISHGPRGFATPTLGGWVGGRGARMAMMLQRNVEFHRFTEGGLRRSPARTQEELPAPEGPLRELKTHLDISQWRASPQGEEHGEQAEEVSQEEVPQEEVQGTQRERELGDEGRRARKEVIEVGEDMPPQTPAMGLRLGDASGSTRQAEERLQSEEVSLPSSGKAPSSENMAERRRERAAVRREALILIDRHLAVHAQEHPDLEGPAPAEPRQELCEPEKEMGAEIPKRVDLRTRERAPVGETTEEKRARRTRRIDEIWQERQRLEAAGELPEQQQERQRLEAAGALPGQPPGAPARAPEIPEMWRDFWEQRVEELPSPVRAGFGVARKAEERLDRKIKFLAKTTFDRHLLLESDLAGEKMKEASHGVRLEAMEMEIQELRALVASQTAIIESVRQQTQGKVDKPESSRQGEQRQPGQRLSRQPSAAEPRQEPPMGRVTLEPVEAKAHRQAQREAFEFRAPTEFATLPVAAADPVVPLAIEEGLPPSSSEPAQGSAEGSMDVLFEAVHTMQEEASLFSPEQRIKEPLKKEMGIQAEGAIESRLQRMGTHEYGPEEIEEQPTTVPGETLERRPQRLDTPEYVPATGDLRSRLGSWATGSGSGGPLPGTEQQEVVSTAAPRSEQQEVVSTLVGSPSSPPPQPGKKKFKRKVDQLCFYCKRNVHHALDYLEFLEDKAAGKVFLMITTSVDLNFCVPTELGFRGSGWFR
ncbi:hypothetical protein CBR_g51504 [Chara braunii]|uniref:Integrase catalytic domain-containing protein n=1 Tax=Chara braunii TaxID=69332 RepID=A0A388K6G4_CHABU|nr:hypothetical protein CBR_g51504 [Chara braunii]|eukprot:GBG65621.1 hypothetical protein CBR_g51504 [Chara braunii]